MGMKFSSKKYVALLQGSKISAVWHFINLILASDLPVSVA